MSTAEFVSRVDAHADGYDSLHKCSRIVEEIEKATRGVFMCPRMKVQRASDNGRQGDNNEQHCSNKEGWTRMRV